MAPTTRRRERAPRKALRRPPRASCERPFTLHQTRNRRRVQVFIFPDRARTSRQTCAFGRAFALTCPRLGRSLPLVYGARRVRRDCRSPPAGFLHLRRRPFARKEPSVCAGPCSRDSRGCFSARLPSRRRLAPLLEK